MDFQRIADSFFAPTCVISVERKPDGGYGEIRIVAGNQKYIDPIEHPAFDGALGLPPQPAHRFVPNSLYETYFPRDLGFEDILYRAAVLRFPIHTYIHINVLDLWFDIFAMPLET